MSRGRPRIDRLAIGLRDALSNSRSRGKAAPSYFQTLQFAVVAATAGRR